MKVSETRLKGCFLFEPQVFYDDRGLFYESFRENELEEVVGEKINFVQDNHSVSKKGVLRGLHFQNEPYAQSKLVRVVQGKVLDVVVDLRKNSETFGEHIKIKMSDENNFSLFIPKGMAHGFLTLSTEAVFTYKCDNYYHQVSERGIVYNDNTLQIDWGVSANKIILSPKDANLTTFKTLFL